MGEWLGREYYRNKIWKTGEFRERSKDSDFAPPESRFELQTAIMTAYSARMTYFFIATDF